MKRGADYHTSIAIQILQAVADLVAAQQRLLTLLVAYENVSLPEATVAGHSGMLSVRWMQEVGGKFEKLTWEAARLLDAAVTADRTSAADRWPERTIDHQ